MDRLIVMRHAKAEKGAGKADFDRTLDPSGWTEADIVARTLADAGLMPDAVLCSSSRRTRDTLCAVLPYLGSDCAIHLARALYDADAPDLLSAVRAAEGACVLLIGHNPSVHTLAMQLAGDAAEAARVRRGFPTAAAAVFAFDGREARFERMIAP